ncbi:MAG: TetR/AcrR family transcriptional regulator [Propionibacteriaceae bacterium]|nr:TetR/AcrR family transcriptional regulator [Propionibacteriaceae bacterium]
MRADARANRDAVVTAATAQMATHGVDISLTAVAEQAGVGIATLYRNFPTRDDLIRAVLADLEGRMLSLIERHSPRIATEPEAAWQEFGHEVAALRPGALVAAFAAEFVTGDQLSEPLRLERVHSLAAVQQILDEAKRAGLVRADLTAEQFQLGIAQATRPLPDVAVPELAEHEAWLVEVYLRGLRP